MRGGGGGGVAQPPRVAPTVNWTLGNVVRTVQEDAEAEVTGVDGNDSERDASSGRRPSGSMGAMAAFGSRRQAKEEADATIDAVEDSIDGSQLIVVFVYCDSTDRKHARNKAASDTFQEEVIGNYDVATALQGCKTIRVDGTELDRDARKTYKLSSHCPQLVLMDINGKQLYRATASTKPETLAKMIEAAKERVNQQVSDR